MKILLLYDQSTGFYVPEIVQDILKDDRYEIPACIVYKRRPKSTREKIKEHIQKRRISYLPVLFFQSLLRKRKARPASQNLSLKTFMQNEGVEVLELNSLYKEESLDLIRGYQADLMVLYHYHGIVRNKLIDLFPEGVLSYHYGDMRKYRGQPAGFWEIYHGEKELGVTVQKISPCIDNGIPVVEKAVKIDPKDDVSRLSARVSKVYPPMMKEAIDLIGEKTEFEPVQSYGKLYTLPTLWQWLVFWMKVYWRRLMN